MSRTSYRKTKFACYLGYVTQAISINLLPLLYLTFQQEFAISLAQLGFLVTVLFVIQIVVDLLAARYGRYLPYRVGSVVAFSVAALGLALLCVLPSMMADPYTGVLLASILLSIGGGLIEVLISPIVDAIPQEGKVGEMSLLHSFYCWGVVAVILLSTLYFALIGIENWRLLVLLWAIVPALTAMLFAVVPMPPKPEEALVESTASPLMHSGLFWLLMALMLFSGATELAPAQWASFFAEYGLEIPKAVGDLLGPCAFAAFQGASRLAFARMTRRHNPRRLLAIHAVGCVISYAIIVLVPFPFVSLLGFCLCGWCVGPMWPGVLGLGSARFPGGGTMMFAMLALCGDMGCAVAPVMVGAVSDQLVSVQQSPAVAMRCGFAVCMLFPVLLALGLMLLRKRKIAT